MRSRGFQALLPTLSAVALVGGCATHRAPLAIAPVAPPVAVAVAPTMPAGAYVGMAIPPVGADGAYATPNRALSSSAAVWHLRAGLNVAALACRGPEETLLIARYNAVLARQGAVLRDAEAAAAAEYRATGGTEWRARYDNAMTVLYNFFSQSFARDTFCATAAQTLADSESVAPADFVAFAEARLPLLDQPFTDFYRRYDAWRTPRPLAAQQVTPTATFPRIELGSVSTLPDPLGHEVFARVPSRALASTQPTR